MQFKIWPLTYCSFPKSYFTGYLKLSLWLILFNLWIGLSANATELPNNVSLLIEKTSKSPEMKRLEPMDGAVAITYKGQVIYKNLFGFQRDHTGPITMQTLFPLASVSKAVSATMLAYLAKQKKLSFEESVSSFVPGIDPKILLKHVLSHSSGYNDNFGNSWVQGGKSHELLIQKLAQIKPEKQPGTNYVYSNIAYSLLENVVSQKTQTPYSQWMEKFLAELNVRGAQICSVTQFERVAYPHQIFRNRLKSRNLPVHYAESVCSAAGLYLSMDQMVQFTNLILGYSPQILSRADLDVLFQPQVEVKDIFWKWQMRWPFPLKELTSYYGLGWRLLQRNKEKKNQLIFHSGHLNGVSTFVGVIHDLDLGIIILSNQDAVFTEPLGMEFWKNAQLL